jgi:hypothetical protein
MGACVCHCEYGLGFHPSDTPTGGPEFWIGAPHGAALARWGVPVCVSRNTLTARASLPRAAESWMCDSGAFSEIKEHGTWTVTPRQYVRDLRRFRDEISRLVWCGPQDWMCEPDMLAKTGLSVREHIHRTVGNYLDLMAEDPGVDIRPTVQGWRPAEYVYCVELYARHGIDLTTYPLVGVGSVCRRKRTRDAVAVLATLAGMGLKLHGYGLKTEALELGAEYLVSADSMAWSADARWARAPLDECVGVHLKCTTCVRWAMRWREKIVRVLEEPRQTVIPLN